MSFENPAEPELELHEWSLSDEYSEPSSITSNEFYCLDGGFASHLPTHYKVRMNRTLCKPTRIGCISVNIISFNRFFLHIISESS